jgi:hypothetical protein
MTLILQIAVGMLFGYLLIEKRRPVFRLLGGFAIILGVVAVCISAGALLWYVVDQTMTAARNYENANVIGREVFSVIQLVLFLVLGVSAFCGLFVFATLLLPKALITLFRRLKKPQKPLALAILTVALAAFLAGSQIILLPPFSTWEASWRDYGLAHGMGYDGETAFHMLLCQALWPVNYLLSKLRGTNPLADIAAITGAQDTTSPSACDDSG